MADMGRAKWRPSGQDDKVVAGKIPVSFVQTAQDTGNMRKSEQDTHDGTFLSHWSRHYDMRVLL